MRNKIYKVCYINMADIVVTIFEAPTHDEAERFAMAYDGGEKELFIKPVYRLPYVRDNGINGREL